ncbi:MAG: glycosyltransferase family 4 protein [Gammaproteobacteria bacterium]|nr:glycosyltransferase family 4 protein [Gammaproteobacteria bacterium]
MNVLYFHQHFSTPHGSTGTRSYEMARHLIRRGHDVTIVCGSYGIAHTGLKSSFKNGKREGVVDNIKIIEFALPYSNNDGFLKRSITFLKFAVRSTNIALFRQYDLLFATSTPLTAGIPGIFAKIIRNKPFVFEVRDLWPELPREMGVIKNPIILWLMAGLEWVSYKSANSCIGLSPGIVKGINRIVKNKKPVAIIPNGCDLDLFDPIAPEISLDFLMDGDFVAVFTGAHGFANGLNAILDVALELKKRGNDTVKIVFIGHGKCKQNLLERKEKQSLDNCFFLEPIAKLELSKLLKRADAGLMVLANVPAFYYGTSPNKFFDYISSGLPVINNYPGWLAGIIKRNDCGIAVPPDSPEAFADALEYMANQPEHVKTMGEHARKLAEQEFNRDILAEQFVNFLEKIAIK